MAPRVEFRPALPGDADVLAPRLRAADRAEVWASHMDEPLPALRRSLAVSRHAWAGLVGGEVACLFGVAPLSLLTGRGAPWLLGSDLAVGRALPFLAASRAVVAHMRRDYPVLENYADARNTVALRWLHWLGFRLEPATPHGPFGMPFHRFTMGT